VPHAPPLPAKHEFSAAAISAAGAGNGRSTKNTEPASDRCVSHVFSNLDNGGREFVTKNDWRKIAKRVMENVQIGAADTAPANLKFDLAVPATWFFYFTQFHVTWTFRDFYEGFHFHFWCKRVRAPGERRPKSCFDSKDRCEIGG
jgi:hypothetical protein